MFVGHYAVALSAKSQTRPLPLWLLFIAVQWMDICWATLVMLGVEKGRITPGFTEANALDLYFMPYTHGLFGALALSLLFGGVACFAFKSQRVLSFVLLSAAVFSHWLLDLVVHTPDLPLWGDGLKVGFGLWHHRLISFPLELGLLGLGAVAYSKVNTPHKSGPKSPWARPLLFGFVVIMAGLQTYANFGPAPLTITLGAQMALGLYVSLALLAAGVDYAHRSERSKP